MKRKIILATHGKFAEGIKSSLELICGKSENVETINAYVEDEFDLTTTVKHIMSKNQEYELVVITDIFGGSVNNEFLKYAHRPNFYLVTGLNLSLLVEIYTQIEGSDSLESLVETAVENSKQMIQQCKLVTEVDDIEEDF